MRHAALNGSILGMLLLAAVPAGAQSLIELGAAMGTHGALQGTGASSAATTINKVRDTLKSTAASSGGSGWMDAGESRGTTGSAPGKGWATAGSGPGSSGKSGWVTAASAGSRVASTGGWASQSSSGGKSGWASKDQPGSTAGRR